MKKLISLFLSLSFILLNTYCSADIQSDIDSLENIMKISSEKEKMRILIILANKYLDVSPDKATDYAKKALVLSKKYNDKKAEINSYYYIAYSYHYKSRHDSALIYFNKALKLSEEINSEVDIANALSCIGIVYHSKGEYYKALKHFRKVLKIDLKTDYRQGIAVDFNNIGNIFKDWGEYDSALVYYHKTLEIFEDQQNKDGVSRLLSNIGNVYLDWEKYDKAKEYYLKSLKIFKELGNKYAIAGILNNVGQVYDDTGEKEKALNYYFKALSINEELDNLDWKSYNLGNIGRVYLSTEQYLKSLSYFDKTLKIAEKTGNKEVISRTLLNIGYANKAIHKYNKAIEAFNKSLKIAKKKGISMIIKDNYYGISETNAAIGNYNKALEYYKLYTQVKDSIFNEESHKQITEMMTKYETEKKEKEIVLLNKEKKLQKTELAQKQAEIKKKNIQRNAFIGGFALVLVLALVLYRGYRQKRRANIMLDEKNVLITRQKAELTQTLEELRATQEQLVESEKMASLGNLVAGVAHEINTPVGIGITASSSLVEETKQFAELYKKDKMNRKALEEYLENTFQASELILKNMNRTGELVQSFKQVSVDQMVDEKRKFNLKSYLSDIMLGIKPEFGKKTIKIDIDCDENLEINSFPGAFAQIITNLTLNSVRHGFRKKEKGNITITAKTKCHSERSEESSHLLLQYKDDGTGISKENLPKIFDPFFTTNKQIGTGLGLHIVYNLVTQKLKGNIKCESKEGKGVLFTINVQL